MALVARLLSKTLKIISASLAKSGTTLILINQLRQTLSSYGNPNVTTGGMAIPFYARQRIEMKKEKVEASDPITEDQGVRIRARVIKNSLAKGNPYKMCNYYAIFGKGIDGLLEMGAVLQREGILTKGGWVYYPSKEDMKQVPCHVVRTTDKAGNTTMTPCESGFIDAKWNGIAKFMDYLMDNSEGIPFFEALLDEKLASGSTGISVSEEEQRELDKLNNNINSSESEVAAATEEE